MNKTTQKETENTEQKPKPPYNLLGVLDGGWYQVKVLRDQAGRWIHVQVENGQEVGWVEITPKRAEDMMSDARFLRAEDGTVYERR